MSDRGARGKVFGIGFSKTGTKTLGRCLRELGYAHFTWEKGLHARVAAGHLDEALRIAERHDSFDDWPWPALYRTLDERFPDGRFVLTVRESSERWFESLSAHVRRWGPTEEFRIIFDTGDPTGDRDRTIAVYEAHNREVLDHFAARPGKLLVVCWEEGDGWQELCRFLGRPVPDAPFPHANKRPRSVLEFQVQRGWQALARRLRRGNPRVSGSDRSGSP